MPIVESGFPSYYYIIDSISISFISSILRNTATPLSFANFCDTRVVNKCNNKEPQQNKVTTWYSFNWYLRKIIQYPNYEERGEIVKRTHLGI